MGDSTEPIVALLTLYEKANVVLRFAILIAVLWPFSVIATAMALKPSTAQTVVPIVDLVPLAAVFLLILGVGFGAVTLLGNPSARKGLKWLAGFIGVELTIGVYFSTVPVSKDIGLIPLLILASLALLFLRVGGIAGILTKALALLIIAITFIFIFGGRKRVEKQVEYALNPPHQVPATEVPTHHPFSRRPVASEPSSPVSTSELTGQEICQDAVPLDYSNFHGTDFVVEMRPDCFSGFIELPSAWMSGWRESPLGDPQGNWISFWFKGYQRPDGPFPALNNARFDNHPASFRLEGRGKVMFFQGTASTPPPPVAPALSSQPRPFEPDWAHAQRQAAQDFVFDIAPCIIRAANLHCFFRVTNEGSDVMAGLNSYAGPTRLIDNGGMEYVAQTVALGAGSGVGGNMATDHLTSGIAVLGSATFQNVTGTSVALLEIKLYVWGVPNPRVDIQCRNLPIERQEGL